MVVIPVLVDRAGLPRGDALPEDMRELVLHQKHDISHEPFGRDVEECGIRRKADSELEASRTATR
jgi:hypothetical protein